MESASRTSSMMRSGRLTPNSLATASRSRVWSYNDTFTQTDLKGNVIWGNTRPDGTADDVAATDAQYRSTRFNSLGYNLVGTAGNEVDFTQEFNATGDQTGVTDAGLGTLANNGGPTQTHALLAGSPAIDAGTCTVNPRNGQHQVTVTWESAVPGVTLIHVVDGRTVSRQMNPTESGSWSTRVKDPPTYAMWGGENRRDTSEELVAPGGRCMQEMQK